jgi:hypothetical protein
VGAAKRRQRVAHGVSGTRVTREFPSPGGAAEVGGRASDPSSAAFHLAFATANIVTPLEFGGQAQTSLFEVCDAPKRHFKEGRSALASMPDRSLWDVADPTSRGVRQPALPNRLAGPYFGSSYSPSVSHVELPSAAALNVLVPFPLMPLSLPAPRTRVHFSSPLWITPSFRVMVPSPR